MACGDGLSGFSEGGKAASSVGMPQDSYTIMHIDLASLECSTVCEGLQGKRQDPGSFGVQRRNLYAFIKGAVVSEGFELSVATNHLGHFLLVPHA